MEVTDVRLNLVNKEGSSVKAIGSFSLDGEFAIRGVRVMADRNGRNFVAFPSREKTDGEYEDLAFPLNKEFYHKVTDSVINEYNHVVEQKQGKQESADMSNDDMPFIDGSCKEVGAPAEEKPARRAKAR